MRNKEPLSTSTLGSKAGGTPERNVIAGMEASIPALRRYAWALVRNRPDADDLVHDCLVRALDRLYTRRTDAELLPWLFAIMHNLFVSGTRRARIRSTLEPLDGLHEATIGRPAAQEESLKWKEVVDAFDTLPAEQRSVLLLVSIENFSYAEVARVLDIPIGTVMSRLSRARERLRRMTEGDPPLPQRRRK